MADICVVAIYLIMSEIKEKMIWHGDIRAAGDIMSAREAEIGIALREMRAARACREIMASWRECRGM